MARYRVATRKKSRPRAVVVDSVPSPMPAISDLATLPLDQQLQHLEAALRSGEDAEALLEACAELRDHAPLSWLSERLLCDGWLASEGHRVWLAQFLLRQPETAVDRALKAMVGDGTFDAIRGPQLRDTLLAMLERVTVERVSVMCLVDRALKHNFAAARDAHVEAVTEHCAQALAAGRTQEVTIDRLAQVSAPGIDRLRAQAATHGPRTAEALEQALGTLALRTIEVLGEAPKAISQANAEELLSKRVYTDPGHFLVELLQNAEDAGAVKFTLRFAPDRIVLWHDGTAFDTRDVVGVTSIGQTTKRKQQIGFFGVGFKSVYEVTDRPQIYSDVYRFEIADVSIPKPLSRRPDDVPADGTVLVLPLRNPNDEERSPAALFAKARELDAIVLFTLRRIDVIELSLVAADGTTTEHAVHELPPDERGISRIRQQPDGWVRGYAVHDAEHVYRGGSRAPGRADRTRVMVGVRVDEHGIPRALEDDTPTVYSYLPTEEHSGLRFFVQGHFDVPVDRERITQDSRWNEWILGKVAPGLAALAGQLTAGLPPEHAARVGQGLLGVLPLAAELGSPIFRRIVARLRQAFEDVPIVPGEDGALHPAAHTVLTSEAMALLFEGRPVQTKAGPLALARRDLDERAVEVAKTLGARPLPAHALIDVLEQHLGSMPDGGRCDDPAAPVFLRDPTPSRIAACYEILDEVAMLRAAGGTGRLVDPSALRRLRTLPLVLSEEGMLHRPGSSIARAGPALREIYAGLRVFVHPEHDAAVDPEDPARVGTTTQIDRLGVPLLDERTLLADLQADLGDGPVADLGATAFGGTPQRLHAALRLLADAAPQQQRSAARLPLFRARDGHYYRAARSPGDHQGVLLFEPGTVGEHLLAYYGEQRPIYVPTEDDPAGVLLRSARTPTLSLGSLVADLGQRRAPLLMPQLDRLHTLLESVRDELPTRARRQLAELPIWPDTTGRCRPLIGQRAVRLPASPAIAALLPNVPFLHAAVLARRHAADMGGETIGLDALIGALASDARSPLRIEPTAASATAVLRILCEHRDAIHPRLRARLVTVPTFVDDAQRPRVLAELSLAEEPALRMVYGGWSGRSFVEPTSITRTAIAQLDLDAKLERVDIATLAIDLGRLHERLDGKRVGTPGLPLASDPEAVARVLAYCDGHAAQMPRTVLLRLCQIAIFADASGRLGALGDGQSPLDPAHVYASEPELAPLFGALGVRVLAPWVPETIASLLDTVGRGRLDVVALVRQLAGLSSVTAGKPRAEAQAEARLSKIHTALVREAPKLARHFGPLPREGAPPSSREVGELAVWPTVAGGVITAHEAVDSEALAEILPDQSPAAAALEAVTVAAPAIEALRSLAPLVQPRSAPGFAAALVEHGALPEQPLAAQPPSLRDPADIARLYTFIGPEHTPRPLAAADGCLRLAPLMGANAATVALLHGTSLAARVVHPEVAARLSEPDADALPALRPAEVVEALAAGHHEPGPLADHPLLHTSERRRQLYTWVVDNESEVFTDAEARQRLLTLPLWPTDRDTLRPAQQLVVDPALPQLDVDWTPHPELPAATLALLVRHLGIGRPPMADLVADHLAPAYHAATARNDGPGAAHLLEYLARALAGTSDAEILGWLAPDGVARVQGAHGRFVDATTLLLPPASLVPAVEAVFGNRHPPPHPSLSPATHALLRTLGVPEMPPAAWVAEAMRRGVASPGVAIGLALLVAQLHRVDPEAAVRGLPLREAAWIVDGAGVVRRPTELFAWTTDVQALVGDAPSLYPAQEITRTLGDGLMAALGLRSARDVRLVEVVANIDRSRHAGVPVPFRVYQWLERGLAEGWLDGAAMRAQLGERAWICSDDGDYHAHARVLGVRALEDFGDRRGYWERGRTQCPRLCGLFGIPDRITPTDRLEFLEEIAAQADERGDRAMFAAEPALARMLLRAYAALGRVDDAPIASRVLVRQCGGDEAGALHLRAPDDSVVLRSDAPALEALFASSGRLFVAAPGPTGDRADIDAYYERCGIRRLRDAYKVRLARKGEDQTAAHAQSIAALRVSLRGLLAVLPRVRLQRTHLPADAWVLSSRLAPLASTGPIRAQQGLEVDYLLEGVGRARTRATAVYDPRSSTLLVDTMVLRDPDTAVTGLAQGLMACIYDGPNEEQLVDIVEILLRLRTRERMDAYLDQRFFPTVDDPQVGLSGQLAARLGELFDYGLDRRLVARFSELADCPLERWRDPALFVGLPNELEPAVWTVVGRMLAAVDRSEASQPLVEALALLLSADSLSDVPAGLLSPPTAAEPPLPEQLRPPDHTPAAATPDESLDLPSLAALEERLAELTGREGAASETGDGVPGLSGPLRGPDRDRLVELITRVGRDGAGPAGDDPVIPSFAGPMGDAQADVTGPARGGFWRRLAQSLGFVDDDEPLLSPRPAWATRGANVLGPTPDIGPQLWMEGRTRRELASHRVPMGMLHEPRVLPAPHRYVVHTLGMSFNVDTQRWSPGSLPPLSALFSGEASGHVVAFAGQLEPGLSVLPIPLYGDVAQLEVTNADATALVVKGRLPGGSALVEVNGTNPVDVRYEVALRRPPVLTEQRPGAWSPGGPTLPLASLPGPVRAWVERNASSDQGAWERARRAEAFVQRNYLYDLDFRERPEVQRVVRGLRPGVGNHHLQVLHASRTASIYGRGVCYELNVMVVELCRHLGVPAMVATGWMLDEGFAARPDHMFALAVVPTVAGPTLLPLDASTGPDGHMRPLAGAEPPEVSVRPSPRPVIEASWGGWDSSVIAGANEPIAIEDHVRQLHRGVREQLDRERDDLRRAIAIANAAAGREPDAVAISTADVQKLRRRALTAVGDRDRLAALLAVIRGEYERAPIVPDAVQGLVREGLATVESFAAYRVRPGDERKP